MSDYTHTYTLPLPLCAHFLIKDFVVGFYLVFGIHVFLTSD